MKKFLADFGTGGSRDRRDICCLEPASVCQEKTVTRAVEGDRIMREVSNDDFIEEPSTTFCQKGGQLFFRVLPRDVLFERGGYEPQEKKDYALMERRYIRVL